MSYDPRKPKGQQRSLEEFIEEFAEKRPEGTLALNLGSGDRPMKSFTNVDVVDLESVDQVVDLYTYPWPWDDNSVSVIYMSHFAEHVPAWEPFWNEIWRVVADEARVVVRGPWSNCDWHWGDPDHKQPLLDRKFLYLNKKWRVENKIDHYWPGPTLNLISEFDPWRFWHPNFTHLTDDAKQWHLTHSYNAVLECAWFLKAFKEEASYRAYLDRITKEAAT